MTRSPIMHNLKCWPEYFRAIKDGRKTFEVRLNDRDFREGDILCLEEYDPDKKEYTGRFETFEAGFILDKAPFVPEGYAVISLIRLY